MLLNTTFITGILVSYYEKKITNAMIFLIIPNAKSCEGNNVFDLSIWLQIFYMIYCKTNESQVKSIKERVA